MQQLIEKLVSRGADSLTDCELLAFLLDDPSLAQALLAAYDGSLADLGHESVARLRMVEGLGLKMALRVAAATEFGRRIVAGKVSEASSVASSDEVVALFRPQLENLSHEECWVIYLTSSNRIIERQRISQGGVQGTVVDHRLIIKHALELLASQLILIHNHPSGAAEPSAQDKVLTDKIARAAEFFDIRLLDHLIISRTGDFSFLRAGLLK
ncbi:MAG: DNA repair protein RadC [Alistipes sp.]